jgi:hypothetical protein
VIERGEWIPRYGWFAPLTEQEAEKCAQFAARRHKAAKEENPELESAPFCLVCQDKHREELDKRLLMGVGIRVVSQQIDRHKGSATARYNAVVRHRTKCLLPTLAGYSPELGRQGVASLYDIPYPFRDKRKQLPSLDEKLEWYLCQYLAMREMARQGGNLKIALDALTRMRDTEMLREKYEHGRLRRTRQVELPAPGAEEGPIVDEVEDERLDYAFSRSVVRPDKAENSEVSDGVETDG